ncbi:Protein claret segregational [Paragonimus heterotremus]|uniref:Protein claret segregational n=1 Tax=Paragonimus heterotremus TaxID=100268 RepID=A0A8J4SK41_9TREM|nr:Protein claret segregational [Paragonimus heterotremus]
MNCVVADRSLKFDPKPNSAQPNSVQSWDEDRVEFVNIPNRGKLQTQIFETRTRVHCYFDPDEATWLRLPITWELYSPAARHLVNLVKDVCPGWGDDADILAALRVSNYNVDDCVNTFHSSIGREGAFSPPMVSSSSKTMVNPSHRSIAFSQENVSQETGDKAYQELTSEIERLNALLSNAKIELARERNVHEQQKISSSQERKKKDTKGVDKVVAPLLLENSIQQVKSFCQEVHELLHGVKHFAQDFASTLAPLVKRLRRLYADQTERLHETQALYRLEAQQRRLTYNTLIELRGNIRVFCRIRPIDCTGSSNCWLQAQENGELVAHLPNSAKRKFQFDHIFHVEATQEQVTCTW